MKTRRWQSEQNDHHAEVAHRTRKHERLLRKLIHDLELKNLHTDALTMTKTR